MRSSQLIVLGRAKNVPETVANSTTLKSLDVNAKSEIAKLEIKRTDMLVITNYALKGRDLYTKTQSVPRSKHSIWVIQTSQLMLYREIVAVCSEIHTKHINTLCGQNVELLNV